MEQSLKQHAYEYMLTIYFLGKLLILDYLLQINAIVFAPIINLVVEKLWQYVEIKNIQYCK